MDFLPWRLRLCFAIYVHVVLLSWSESAVEGSRNETDKLALLAFKAAVTQDPQQVMISWNDSNHFCDWIGVTCLSSERVVTLNLKSLGLVGSISPSVGNLSFLTGINLMSNNFHGKIPEELSRLLQLQYLNLSFNSFNGEIPCLYSKDHFPFPMDQKRAIRILKEMMKERFYSEKKYGDFLDVVIEEMKKDEPLFNVESAAYFVFIILFTSFETVSLVITLAIKFISKHPSVLKDLGVHRAPFPWSFCRSCYLD